MKLNGVLGELEPGGVRSPHDHRDLLQRRVVDPVLAEEGVEAAERPVMGELDSFDVERRGAFLERAGEHLRRRREEELRLRVDVARDEPGAGDPVHLGAFAGDPFHGASGAGGLPGR